MAGTSKKSIEVLLRAIVDKKTTETEINRTVKEIESRIKNNPVKMTVSVDEKALKKNQQKILQFQEKMRASISNLNAKQGSLLGMSQKKDLTEFEKKLMSLKAKTPDLTHKIKMMTIEYDRLAQGIKNVNKAKSDAAKKQENKELQNLKNELKLLDQKDKKEKALYDEKIKRINQLISATNKANAKMLSNAQNYAKARYEANAKRLTQEQKIAEFQASMASKINSLRTGSAGKYMTKDQKNQLIQLTSSYKSLSRATPNLRHQMQMLGTEFRNINTAAQNTANSSMKLGEMLKNAFSKFPRDMGL